MLLLLLYNYTSYIITYYHTFFEYCHIQPAYYGLFCYAEGCLGNSPKNMDHPHWQPSKNLFGQMVLEEQEHLVTSSSSCFLFMRIVSVSSRPASPLACMCGLIATGNTYLCFHCNWQHAFVDMRCNANGLREGLSEGPTAVLDPQARLPTA